jgi:deoxyribonucleoside regulator
MDNKERDFLIEVAKLYYEEEFSQQEIANKFNISRPTVSNLLKRCKDEKIVEISIKSPSSLILSLKRELELQFKLKNVIIVPSEAEINHTKAKTGKAAGEYLMSILHNNMRIGIAWGTTLYQTVNELPQTNFIDIDVVQLIGALGSINPTFDGFELAMNLAKKVNGKYYIIQAPVIVQSIHLKEMLVKEPRVSDVLSLAKNIDLALVGVGSIAPEESSLVRAGFMTKEETGTIIKEGAVGVICGMHYDINGKLLNTSINKRLIGISPEDLLKIPVIIGMACGSEKTNAVLGALRGGFINTLVTDENIALRILSELKNDRTLILRNK